MLIRNISALELLEIIQLATIMQMLSTKPQYAGLITTLRTDENLTIATLRKTANGHDHRNRRVQYIELF